MHHIVIALITAISAIAGLFPAPIQPVSVAGSSQIAEPSMTSLEPAVVLVGGSPVARRRVLDAVDRFVSAGLALPGLEVRFHDGSDGCEGTYGLFNQIGDRGRIDLCQDRELLALHELGHAWERFTLDDDDRAAFLAVTGADEWRGADIPHPSRGTEIAAEAIAYGLLTDDTVRLADRPLELFEILTGSESPRRAELEQAGEPASSAVGAEMTEAQQSGRAAYAAAQTA